MKVFGPGRPPGYPPGRPRDILPKNFMVSLLFPASWNGVWGRGCDETEVGEEKRLFTESQLGIQ